MDRQRILELAAETLERHKSEINAEIEAIRTELGAAGSKTRAAAGIHRRRTRAERKALSLRMKEYWAAKKVSAVKPSAVGRTPVASALGRPKSAAQKKALSLIMKRVWAKRKSEAAQKAAKEHPKA